MCEASDFPLINFFYPLFNQMSGYQNKVRFPGVMLYDQARIQKMLIAIASRVEEKAGLSTVSTSECWWGGRHFETFSCLYTYRWPPTHIEYCATWQCDCKVSAKNFLSCHKCCLSFGATLTRTLGENDRSDFVFYRFLPPPSFLRCPTSPNPSRK